MTYHDRRGMCQRELRAVASTCRRIMHNVARIKGLVWLNHIRSDG